MPKGGKRAGAGRPKGTLYPYKKNRLPIIASAEARKRLQELTPMDVMIKTMMGYVEAAEILGKNIVKVDDRIVTQLQLLKQASEIAKDAAPYVHSKKATVLEHGGPGGGKIEHQVTVEFVKGAAPR
jgi:hypothetical protein